jgi:hypothetical protein
MDLKSWFHYSRQRPSQVLTHKLYSRPQLTRHAAVVQLLSQLASPFAQLWQHVGSSVAEAEVGFANTNTAKTRAKRMNIRNNGRM